MIARLLTLSLLLSGCLSFHTGPLPGEPKKGTFAAIDDTRIHYTDSGGADRPLVLLHGFASSLDAWKKLRPSLAGRRVIALDLKGFGWSDRPEGDYSPEAQARLVFGLLDRLGVGQSDVVGHSWGASVALAMAMSKPKRVDRLVLMSAWAYADQLPTFFVWARSGLGEVLFSLFYRERVEDRLTLAFHDKSHISQALVDKTEEAINQPGTVAAALAAVRGQRYEEAEAKYPTVTHKTLLLWCREDLVTPVWVGERLNKTLPDSKLVVFGGCGHLPMVEATEDTGKALTEFLAR